MNQKKQFNSKKALAILGSPHSSGITAAMLQCAVRSAEKNGFEVTQIHLYKKQLSYCCGCNQCMNTGCCIQKDDIQEIERLFHESGLIILAAPVYWANVPAAVKNMFDRLRGTAMEETAAFPMPHLRGRSYILLTSCNTPSPFSWLFGQSRGAIRSMDEFFRTAGMKCRGKFVCAGALGKKELPGRLAGRIERCLCRL